MSKHRDIVAFIKFTDSEGEERSRSTRIGVAFPTKGDNFRLKFDFIPTDPATELVILKPKARGAEEDAG